MYYTLFYISTSIQCMWRESRAGERVEDRKGNGVRERGGEGNRLRNRER